jgi:cytochrome c556
MNNAKKRIWIAIAVVLGVAISVSAMTATEAIKERKKAMEGVRDNLMVLGAIAKKEKPFDAEVVHASAAAIAEKLAHSADLFPEGSDQGEAETDAKAEIWTNREQFDTFLEASRQAAIDMQSVSTAEEFPPALGKLGNTCKSCHDLFRKPQQ